MKLPTVKTGGKIDKVFCNSTDAANYAKELVTNGINRQSISCRFESLSLESIVAMFDEAAEHIKKPKLKFTDFKLTRADVGNYVGAVYIKNDNGWVARINRDGSLVRNIDNHIKGLETELAKLAESPAGYAAAHGLKTSKCCFCSIELSNTRSIEVGYGPICAENYGLPY